MGLKFVFGNTLEENQKSLAALSKQYGSNITDATNTKNGVNLSSNGTFLGTVARQAYTDASFNTVQNNQAYGPSVVNGAVQDANGEQAGPAIPETSQLGTQEQGPTQNLADTQVGNEQYGPQQPQDQSVQQSQQSQQQSSQSSSDNGYFHIDNPSEAPKSALDSLLGLNGSGGSGSGGGNGSSSSGNNSAVTLSGAASGGVQPNQNLFTGANGQKGGPAQTELDIGYEASKAKLFGDRRKGILSTILSGDKGVGQPLLIKPSLLGQ